MMFESKTILFTDFGVALLIIFDFVCRPATPNPLQYLPGVCSMEKSPRKWRIAIPASLMQVLQLHVETIEPFQWLHMTHIFMVGIHQKNSQGPHCYESI